MSPRTISSPRASLWKVPTPPLSLLSGIPLTMMTRLGMMVRNYRISIWRPSLVNPHVDGQVWQIDPVWIEKRNRVQISRKASKLFHQFPGEACALIGWYKMKNFELSCIRTAVESIRLNVNPEEAMDAVGGVNG